VAAAARQVVTAPARGHSAAYGGAHLAAVGAAQPFAAPYLFDNVGDTKAPYTLVVIAFLTEV